MQTSSEPLHHLSSEFEEDVKATEFISMRIYMKERNRASSSWVGEHNSCQWNSTVNGRAGVWGSQCSWGSFMSIFPFSCWSPTFIYLWQGSHDHICLLFTNYLLPGPPPVASFCQDLLILTLGSLHFTLPYLLGMYCLSSYFLGSRSLRPYCTL